MLPKFESKSALSFDINRIQCSNKKLCKHYNRIKHHTIPVAKYNKVIVFLNVSNRKKNETKKATEDDIKSPPCKRRSSDL